MPCWPHQTSGSASSPFHAELLVLRPVLMSSLVHSRPAWSAPKGDDLRARSPPRSRERSPPTDRPTEQRRAQRAVTRLGGRWDRRIGDYHLIRPVGQHHSLWRTG